MNIFVHYYNSDIFILLRSIDNYNILRPTYFINGYIGCVMNLGFFNDDM